jgi:hypothetical protein
VKELPVPGALAKAIRDRFLASHNVEKIDVTAYDLPGDPRNNVGIRRAARSVCVVIHYPALTPKNGDPLGERVRHAVVCRYHLKPGVNLDAPATIRGVLTRVSHDIASAYKR